MSTLVKNAGNVEYTEMFLNMVTLICCDCGVPFGVPVRLNQCFRDTGQYFSCPNGHSQHYSKSSVELLKEKYEKEQQELRESISRRENTILKLQSEIATEKGRSNYHKGKLKKAKNRAAAGLCLCCNRSFSNLANHMKSKHPEEVKNINK